MIGVRLVAMDYILAMSQRGINTNGGNPSQEALNIGSAH